MAAKGQKLYFSQFGGEQPIPPEFIAAMERKEEVQSLGENTTGPESLSDLIVESKVETNRTDERVRRTVRKKAGNITLSAIRTNDQGQPVQVTLALHPTGTTPSVPSATQNVAVKDLGNGWSIMEVGVEGSYTGPGGAFVAGVFPGTMNETRQAITIPDKFRQAGATLNVTAATTAGTTATTTTLGTGGTGIIDSKAQRVDLFKVRLEDTTLTANVNTSVQEYGYFEGLVAPITTTFVDDNAGASSGGLLVTNIRREVIGGGKATNSVESVASWPTRYGQDYDPRTGLVRPWIETTVAPNTNVGTAALEIHPVDYARALNRQYDTSAINTAMAAVEIKIAGKTVVDLPDVLTGLTTTYNKNAGTGSGGHPAANQALIVTGAGSASSRINDAAQASGAISVELIPAITRYSGKRVPCTHCFFYLPLPVTTAQVLTKLTSMMGATVLDLPVFKEKIYTFILKSMQVSLRQEADSDVGFSFNTSGTQTSKSVQWGSSKSGEIGVTSRPVTIGPVINDAITISSASDTQAVSVTVSANTNAVTGTVAISAITNEPSSASQDATASVTPSSISATTPASVPTSGLRMVDLSPDIGEYGYAFIHAVVVDFANYA